VVIGVRPRTAGTIQTVKLIEAIEGRNATNDSRFAQRKRESLLDRGCAACYLIALAHSDIVSLNGRLRVTLVWHGHSFQVKDVSQPMAQCRIVAMLRLFAASYPRLEEVSHASFFSLLFRTGFAVRRNCAGTSGPAVFRNRDSDPGWNFD
jgi:hypothetical protein